MLQISCNLALCDYQDNVAAVLILFEIILTAFTVAIEKSFRLTIVIFKTFTKATKLMPSIGAHTTSSAAHQNQKSKYFKINYNYRSKFYCLKYSYFD